MAFMRRPVEEYIEKAKAADTKDRLLKALTEARRWLANVKDGYYEGFYSEDEWEQSEKDYNAVYAIVSDRLELIAGKE
jgi:hypothetical protein